MSLSTVLALIDPEHGAATLKLAALASETLGAPVDGIVVKPDPRDSIPAIGEAMTGDLVAQVMQETERAGADMATKSRGLFDAAGLGEAARFFEATGRVETVVAQEGRTRAMTVLPCGGVGEGDTRAIGAALFDTGRPTLIAPLHEVKSVGKRAAVFWKDSQEAANAVWSAVPFLRTADEVTLFTVGDDLAAAKALERLADGLARAGVKADSKLIEPGPGGDSAQLVDAASEMDADLIVMGAYSHSRLQELIFGGVTQDMLDSLARPVLMAH